MPCSRSYRVGLAVSGGADSTALLVLMAQLQKSHGFDAVVLHVDHGLRKESSEDAAFVRRLAREFGLPFHGFRARVVRQKGESIEMAARRVRLGFFADAMKRHRLDCIATGHHMDDVAETFLMRLKRASGAEGLAGLRPISHVDGIVFIRPLLNVRGCDLRRFLTERGMSWREDCTNSDTSILRNKVRHVILPFLERELDPDIVEHICRSAGYLREGCARMFPAICTTEMPHGMQRKVDSEEVRPVSDAPSGNAAANCRYVLEISESIGFGKELPGIGNLPASASFDADALRGRTVEMRMWRPGDWMRPCGFPHRRKLQDIFVTAKTPPDVRRTLPIAADADTGEVLWIPGYRVSETVKVRSMDAPSVRFALSREKGGNAK